MIDKYESFKKFLTMLPLDSKLWISRFLIVSEKITNGK